ERPARKRFKPQVGDLFAIGLVGGRWGLGHIVASKDTGARSCHILFAKHAASVEELRERLDEVTRDPVGLVVSNVTDIKVGTGPIIVHLDPDYPGIRLPSLDIGVGTNWYTPGFLPEFIEAYNGLRNWDDHEGMAEAYREILLPHLPIPPS